MFADFLKSFLAPDPKPLDDADARLALTALLVRLARADGYYTQEEKHHIDRIITARYGLGQIDADTLRTRAETFESEAPDTVRFTRAVKDAVPYEERTAILEALWKVALADGERDAHEDSLIRLASSLLGISDRDSALARKRVMNGE
ncbi:MAG: TerB family tellurite resistance protein [Roseovarius sp.]|nr:TerB family tellurite resistance protein [Roseovarius sp.]MCY4293054.1 TerB family tellurite resistance protein [Roseovarius sp.]